MDKKNFSPEFQKDMADLLDMCAEHKTDSVTVSMDYGKQILDIDITFKIREREEK